MPTFSLASEAKLATCDVRLRELFHHVIADYDCTIICGHRGEAEQREAFRTGKSKLDWPNSKHNVRPSLAVDVAPCPIDWNDRSRFILFAGYVLGVGNLLGIPLRWGGDWDSNRTFNESFVDLVHFELV